MENFLLITIIINLIINIFFFVVFELKRPSVKEFIPLAVICSAASLSRLIFSFIPQVQPVTVLVAISGSAYGPIYGYITGSLCALLSNMFLGQGPWTVFQMTGWGTIGFLAGLLGYFFRKKSTSSLLRWENNKIELIIFAVFAAISAFIFSIITDFMTISYLGETLNISSALTVFITGILFNINHAIFNVIFIVILYYPIKRKLIRLTNKASLGSDG